VVIVQGMFRRDLLPQYGITSIAALQQRLGLTKRYAWLLWHGKVALSADMMRRLRAELGIPLDLQRLAEEVESVRKTERRAVRRQLRLILSHLLKWCYQPDMRTDSWRSTIANGCVLVQEDLDDLPSLAPELPELSIWAYPRARGVAAQETGLSLATSPEACPWPIAQVLAEDFRPEETS
jgi:transcriptional regulator with XRE-family HTH domain